MLPALRAFNYFDHNGESIFSFHCLHVTSFSYNPHETGSTLHPSYHPGSRPQETPVEIKTPSVLLLETLSVYILMIMKKSINGSVFFCFFSLSLCFSVSVSLSVRPAASILFHFKCTLFDGRCLGFSEIWWGYWPYKRKTTQVELTSWHIGTYIIIIII